MTLVFTALLMLCGLGGASFSTMARGKSEIAAAVAVSIIVATAKIPIEAVPDARWIGCVSASIATVLVFRPSVRWIGPLFGGALAGLLGALLEAQGLPVLTGSLLAVAVSAVPAYFAVRRPGFAPEALQQEAMLGTAAIGLAVALIPEIRSGWQSALALNREEGSGNSSNQIIANWVLVLSAASVVLGGLYSLLRRR